MSTHRPIGSDHLREADSQKLWPENEVQGPQMWEGTHKEAWMEETVSLKS